MGSGEDGSILVVAPNAPEKSDIERNVVRGMLLNMNRFGLESETVVECFGVVVLCFCLW